VLLKLDFHTHTKASDDAGQSSNQLFDAAIKKGLSGLAVTDHNAFHHNSHPELYIIPAAEYSTDVGHLLVFFLSAPLEETLSYKKPGSYDWRDVVSGAHKQDALVFVAHPFSPDYDRPDSFWDTVDGVEIFNARIEHSRNRGANKKALSIMKERGLAFSCGSDAHFRGEVGCTHWECEIDVVGKTHDEVLAEVRRRLTDRSGRISPGVASPFYRCGSQWLSARHSGKYKKILRIPARFIYGLYTLTVGRRKDDYDVFI